MLSEVFFPFVFFLCFNNYNTSLGNWSSLRWFGLRSAILFFYFFLFPKFRCGISKDGLPDLLVCVCV